MKPARSFGHRAPATHALGVDLAQLADTLKAGGRLRQVLKPWGRLQIDRPLPFLCLYRRPAGEPDVQSESLITTQASYLLAPGEPAVAHEANALLRTIVRVSVDDFGACLIIEVSVARRTTEDGAAEEPLFRIITETGREPAASVAELEEGLTRIADTVGATAGVEIDRRRHSSSRYLAPLLDRETASNRCFLLGLEVSRVCADLDSAHEFPVVHRRLRHELANVLKRTAFKFTNRRTTQRPAHYHALGRGTFIKVVWDVDRALAEVSNRFDFLLLSTPRNADAAWTEFRRRAFDATPRFSYPPLPFDPVLAKRDLYRIPLERIEDPTLDNLFREQQDELNRKITMLADRDTPLFRYGSLQLFGAVDNDLFNQARQLLESIPSRSRDAGTAGSVDARAFAARAEAELRYLRGMSNQLTAHVHIREDISGLVVSRGHLLIPASLSIPSSRVEALLQHEVGTHIVTYYNGAAQPLRQLRNGLPGYDELQEGLAVLAEYLVGGLSRARLRILAARVLAVKRMTDGASFVEVFRELDRDYDFAQRTAYTVTMRVFRGGGQAKDAVYLRGLVSLLAYFGRGGEVNPLLIGKIGLGHLEMVTDLQARHVLVDPPFRPRYLQQPEAVARLARLQRGITLADLVTRSRRLQ
jgi:uncharacterized protein (TIGR02421 family)